MIWLIFCKKTEKGGAIFIQLRYSNYSSYSKTLEPWKIKISVNFCERAMGFKEINGNTIYRCLIIENNNILRFLIQNETNERIDTINKDIDLCTLEWYD